MNVAINRFFYRHPWIRPTLWIAVVSWAMYFARAPILFAMRNVWTAFSVPSMTLLKWWWSVIGTLYTLAGQLCVAIPATALAYFTMVHILWPIFAAATILVLEFLTAKPEPPHPQSFEYTHTHSNGQSFTHNMSRDEMAEILRAAVEEELRERREQAEKEAQSQRSSQGAKSKRRGKKRKN